MNSLFSYYLGFPMPRLDFLDIEFWPGAIAYWMTLGWVYAVRASIHLLIADYFQRRLVLFHRNPLDWKCFGLFCQARTFKWGNTRDGKESTPTVL